MLATIIIFSIIAIILVVRDILINDKKILDDVESANNFLNDMKIEIKTHKKIDDQLFILVDVIIINQGIIRFIVNLTKHKFHCFSIEHTSIYNKHWKHYLNARNPKLRQANNKMIDLIEMKSIKINNKIIYDIFMNAIREYLLNKTMELDDLAYINELLGVIN